MSEDKREMNLEALVSKLQKEGVDKANAEGNEIIKRAEEKAKSIREKAEKDADTMLAKARSEAEQFQKNAVSSVELAGRDLILSLKEKVKELFDNAFKTEIAGAMDDALLVSLITKLVDQWAKGDAAKVELNRDDTDKLLKQVQAAVNSSFKDGIEIKQNRNIKNGFRISKKDNEVNYDFTNETIAEALKVHLNPKLAELIKVTK